MQYSPFSVFFYPFLNFFPYPKFFIFFSSYFHKAWITFIWNSYFVPLLLKICILHYLCSLQSYFILQRSTLDKCSLAIMYNVHCTYSFFPRALLISCFIMKYSMNQLTWYSNRRALWRWPSAGRTDRTGTSTSIGEGYVNVNCQGSSDKSFIQFTRVGQKYTVTCYSGAGPFHFDTDPQIRFVEKRLRKKIPFFFSAEYPKMIYYHINFENIKNKILITIF